MSRAKRKGGSDANPNSFFPTDPRAVLAAIEDGYGEPLPGGTWADPCAGTGAIIEGVARFFGGAEARRLSRPASWMTCDIDPQFDADYVADFLECKHLFRGADCIITNPPFTGRSPEGKAIPLAFLFAKACLDLIADGGAVLFLVRYGFLTVRNSARRELNRAANWDVYPASPRPSFGRNGQGKRGTDSTEYVWIRGGPGARGKHFPAVDWRAQ